MGESYGEHARVAGRFGAEMIVGGLACLVHAAVPALCKTSGSRTIARLHARLVAKRSAVKADRAQVKSVEYVI